MTMLLLLFGCLPASERPFLSDLPAVDIAMGWAPRKMVLYENGWISANQGAGRRGRYKAISSSRDFRCAVDEEGTAQCWGGSSEVNQQIEGDFHSITAGTDVACAWGDDGSVCFGDSGFGATADLSIPDAQAMASSRLASCAALESEVVCWGDRGAELSQSGSYTSLAFLGLSLCGTRANDVVECWGPEIVLVPDVVIDRIVSHDGRACGLDDDGHAQCFGTIDAGFPTNTPTGTVFSAVAVGDEEACGTVVGSGVPECWSVLGWFQI